MLTDDKYFTPSIEDIRIGYEFEFNGNPRDLPADWRKVTVTPDWYSMNYTSGWDPDPLISFYIAMLRSKPEYFRVSYLTKEQIEAKGWGPPEAKFILVPGKAKCYTYTPMQKGERWLWFDPRDYTFAITSVGGGKCYFEGMCKDINTLRDVCKLLRI